MSVPTWRRKLSATEYVYQVYLLNIRLGEVLNNKPKKYKVNYADAIIKTALEALEHCQIADELIMQDKCSLTAMNLIEENLLLALGKVSHLATRCYIFLEIVRQHDFAAQQVECEYSKYHSKIYRQELELGIRCERCYELIQQALHIHCQK